MENGFLHVKAEYIAFIDKNLLFDLRFVKIVTMFKLLVILFIIKLYAWNDIFKVNFVILQFISSWKYHRKMFPEPSPKFTQIEMVLIMEDGIFAATNIDAEFNDPF